MEPFAAIFLAIIGTVGFVAFITLMTLFRAFVLIKLWDWFMIPFLAPFTSEAVHLTYPIAIGLSLIMSMFQSHNYSENEDLAKVILYPFVVPAITLLMGWIVTLFM